MTRRHTVLVVDDEPDVVASVKDLLRLDYKVIGATRAAEGLDILDRENVHVVMTDQRMPEMTGVQFLSNLRGKHPEVVRLLFAVGKQTQMDGRTSNLSATRSTNILCSACARAAGQSKGSYRTSKSTSAYRSEHEADPNR